MKKTYISPNTLIYAVAIERNLLAGSNEPGTSVKSGDADPTKDVLTRRNYDVWGEDEEEDY